MYRETFFLTGCRMVDANRWMKASLITSDRVQTWTLSYGARRSFGEIASYTDACKFTHVTECTLLNRSSLGRGVLALVLKRSAITPVNLRTSFYGSTVLGPIESWTVSLLRNQRLVDLPWLIGRWLIGSNAFDPSPKSREARLSVAGVLGRTAFIQWCPFWSATNKDISEAQVAECLHFYALAQRACSRLASSPYRQLRPEDVGCLGSLWPSRVN
jgi:hypothetical protein